MERSKENILKSNKELEGNEHTRSEDFKLDTESVQEEIKHDTKVTEEFENKESNEDKTKDIILGDTDNNVDTELVKDAEQPEISKIGIYSVDNDKEESIESDEKSSIVTIVSKLDLDLGIKETEIKVPVIKDSLEDSVVDNRESYEDSNTEIPSEEDDVRDELWSYQRI